MLLRQKRSKSRMLRTVPINTKWLFPQQACWWVSFSLLYEHATAILSFTTVFCWKWQDILNKFGFVFLLFSVLMLCFYLMLFMCCTFFVSLFPQPYHQFIPQYNVCFHPVYSLQHLLHYLHLKNDNRTQYIPILYYITQSILYVGT